MWKLGNGKALEICNTIFKHFIKELEDRNKKKIFPEIHQISPNIYFFLGNFYSNFGCWHFCV